ncbi:PQ-loop repeat family protein / transmembrane family protein [Prunus dulcis]|uniref:PQ-loop repeat family protein / transmembrane family protein n=1 Tax=Prunus dulcis TaxID=3755 RepID=A0A4Y1RTG4_PRUDU|nr:PQ-loop repeat family protein / transmembrane family protein [Prunus dulcis]
MTLFGTFNHRSVDNKLDLIVENPSRGVVLRIRKGNVEGLNPLMFVFAVLGNATYVASIILNSLDWSEIRPNLPWLILIQFFRYWRHQDPEDAFIKPWMFVNLQSCLFGVQSKVMQSPSHEPETEISSDLCSQLSNQQALQPMGHFSALILHPTLPDQQSLHMNSVQAM